MMKYVKLKLFTAIMVAIFMQSVFAGEIIELAADNCFAVGQSYAASQGATLVAAEAATQNGASVCKVVVLMQTGNGGRPKREVVYIPQ